MLFNNIILRIELVSDGESYSKLTNPYQIVFRLIITQSKPCISQLVQLANCIQSRIS